MHGIIDDEVFSAQFVNNVRVALAPVLRKVLGDNGEMLLFLFCVHCGSFDTEGWEMSGRLYLTLHLRRLGGCPPYKQLLGPALDTQQ